MEAGMTDRFRCGTFTTAARHPRPPRGRVLRGVVHRRRARRAPWALRAARAARWMLWRRPQCGRGRARPCGRALGRTLLQRRQQRRPRRHPGLPQPGQTSRHCGGNQAGGRGDLACMGRGRTSAGGTVHSGTRTAEAGRLGRVVVAVAVPLRAAVLAPRAPVQGHGMRGRAITAAKIVIGGMRGPGRGPRGDRGAAAGDVRTRTSWIRRGARKTGAAPLR